MTSSSSSVTDAAAVKRFNETISGTFAKLQKWLKPTEEFEETAGLVAQLCTGSSKIGYRRAEPYFKKIASDLWKKDENVLSSIEIFQNVDLKGLNKEQKQSIWTDIHVLLRNYGLHDPSATKLEVKEVKTRASAESANLPIISTKQVVQQQHLASKGSEMSSASSFVNPPAVPVDVSKPVAATTNTDPADTKPKATNTSDEADKDMKAQKEEFSKMLDSTFSEAMEYLGPALNFKAAKVKQFQAMLKSKLTSNACMKMMNDLELVQTKQEAAGQNEEKKTPFKSDPNNEARFCSLMFNMNLLTNCIKIADLTKHLSKAMQTAFTKFSAWIRLNYQSEIPLTHFEMYSIKYADELKKRTFFDLPKEKSVPELVEFGLYDILPSLYHEDLYEYLDTFTKVTEDCKSIVKTVPEMVHVLAVWMHQNPIGEIRAKMEKDKTLDLATVTLESLLTGLQEKDLYKELLIALDIIKDRKKVQSVIKFFKSFVPMIKPFLNR